MDACSLCRRSTYTRPCHGLYGFDDYKTADTIVNSYEQELP
jgi:hypothetical protein